MCSKQWNNDNYMHSSAELIRYQNLYKGNLDYQWHIKEYLCKLFSPDVGKSFSQEKTKNQYNTKKSSIQHADWLK